MPPNLPSLNIQPRRMQRDILRLARFTSPRYPYQRLAFSPQDRAARRWLIRQMEAAGLSVRLDEAGNIIGARAGRRPAGPVVMMGSHIDTVKSGGRFDGIAGVITALEVVRCLNEAGWSTEHPLEVVCFTAEEPTAPGMSPVGSRAMAGALDYQRVPTEKAPFGGAISEGIDLIGGDSGKLRKAQRRWGDILGYLELHIEQGPVLERKGLPVGVVTAIAGPSRGVVTIEGRADHSGGTLMHERFDALCGASELILALERICRSDELTDTVGTVGVVENFPNMVNIIPGRTELQVDVRSIRRDYIDQVKVLLAQEVERIARERRLRITLRWGSSEDPVPIPLAMLDLVQRSADELGIPSMPMVSRASHDSARIAPITPIGMVFVPSHDGLSHCPEEWTDFEDIAQGARVLGRALLKLDALSLEDLR